MSSSSDDVFVDDDERLAHSPDQWRFSPMGELLDALDKLSARASVDLAVPDDVAEQLRDLAVAIRRQARVGHD